MPPKEIDRADNTYLNFVREIKDRVVSARITAARSINRELIHLYWDIGKAIVERQKKYRWGNAVVEMLSKDLQAEFPSVTGFSPRNLWDMKRFYETYTDAPPILRQLVAELPWGHNILILQQVSEESARRYYLEAAAKFGWSRNVLMHQIKTDAYERARLEKKTHNFPAVLPEYLAEQADEALKSSYNLEFLGIQKEVRERELEDRLIERLCDFILELGYGFCFVGRQHRLAIGEKEYFIDLLFYHRFLKALVAFELKVGSFEPEYSGKMDFYLNVLNEKEKAPDDNPSIGIILCTKKEEMVVEFSLKTKTNPIGVAEYHLTRRLPKELKGKLPTEKELRKALLAEAEKSK